MRFKSAELFFVDRFINMLVCSLICLGTGVQFRFSSILYFLVQVCCVFLFSVQKYIKTIWLFMNLGLVWFLLFWFLLWFKSLLYKSN